MRGAVWGTRLYCGGLVETIFPVPGRDFIAARSIKTSGSTKKGPETKLGKRGESPRGQVTITASMGGVGKDEKGNKQVIHSMLGLLRD